VIYNVELYIEQCLRSLFEQTLDDIEYIFVDDSSTDQSIEILNNILNEYPGKRAQTYLIQNKQNLKQAASRQIGLSKARGEYIIYCDSDDWADKDMYKSMYEKAKLENADIVCCNYISHKKEDTIIRYNYTEETKEIIKNGTFALLETSLCNKLIKKKLYEENNIFFFPGIDFMEDKLLTTKLRYFSKKTIIIPDAHYHYRVLSNSTSNSGASIKKLHQSIKCAEQIELFFLQQGQNIYNDFFLMIEYQKFISKSALFYKEIRNLILWKDIYPETNKYIFKYKHLTLKMRFCYWLAAKNFCSISIFTYDIGDCIKKAFRN